MNAWGEIVVWGAVRGNHRYSGDLKFDHLKSRLFEVRISNGRIFKWSGLRCMLTLRTCRSLDIRFEENELIRVLTPDHSKTGPFVIQTFLSGFQMVFDKMAAICLDFKWLGLRISDPIQNPGNLQPNLFWTIQNPN